MAQLTLPIGCKLLIGAPARSFEKDKLLQLQAIVSAVPAIRAAYVPMMFAEGFFSPPKQVLFIVVDDAARASLSRIVQAIEERIRGFWPAGDWIDIFPAFNDSEILRDVAQTGCILHSRE